MSSPYLGELRLVSFNFAPKGWALSNGQLMAINQSQALFSLLGTTYGGNGIQTFGLPNLQGRTPNSMGNGYTIGQQGGEENHTLISTEVPTHTHLANAIATGASASTAGGNYLAGTSGNLGIYASTSSVAAMNSAVVGSVGGSQPHTNQQPYLVMNWIIALQGIFPSQN